MRMSTIPPNSSARALYFAPNRLPSFTPSQESAKVMTPMKVTAGAICT